VGEEELGYKKYLSLLIDDGLSNNLINRVLIARKTVLIRSGRALMLGKFKHILVY
jgi:hypothetical protein